MSSAILQGGASGSGSMTLLAPNTNSNQTVTIPDASGTAMVSGNMPAFSAYQSSAQTFSSASWTKINLQTEEYDTAACFDTTTSRFTPNVAGYYSCVCMFAFTTNANSRSAVYKNGSVYKYGSLGTTDCQSSAIVYLNGTTDYIEMFVAPNTSPLTGATGPNFSYFQAALVRAA